MSMERYNQELSEESHGLPLLSGEEVLWSGAPDWTSYASNEKKKWFASVTITLWLILITQHSIHTFPTMLLILFVVLILLFSYGVAHFFWLKIVQFRYFLTNLRVIFDYPYDGPNRYIVIFYKDIKKMTLHKNTVNFHSRGLKFADLNSTDEVVEILNKYCPTPVSK